MDPLAALFASSSDGVIAHDPAGTILSLNPAAARIFGAPEALLCGSSIVRLLPAALGLLRGDPGLVHARSLAVGARDHHGHALQLEITHVPLQGTTQLPVGGFFVVRPMTGAPAVPAPSVATAWSIGDAERLNLVLSASGLGDWSWDRKTDVVTLSARAADIFGVKARTTTWAALRELMHPDDREPARLAVERAVVEHSDYALEYRLLDSELERWISARGHARYDEQGRPLGMLGVVQDISRDRLLLRVDDAVRSLIQSEDITYTAARVLGQYLRVNRCAYADVEDDQDTFNLTGNYTHGVRSIVGTYRFRQFGAGCLSAMRAGRPWVVQDSAVDPRLDAEDRTAYELTAIRSVVCVPIMKLGRFVAAMAVHALTPRSWSDSDIELVQQVASRCWESIERARVERERESLLEAAEAANRAKDEFMAMLGHELRNPLAPMFTALHLMKSRGDSAFARERAVIERQVVHLARLVDDLLDVSRITRGKVELKQELVELAEIVTRAVDVASPLLEQRAHKLTVEVAPVGLLIYGDVTRLVQVVSNLLTNAAKYTPQAGRIAVSATLDDGEVVLRVADSGVGMTPEVVQGAFDIFVQGRQSIDRAHGGLGLGLTIVRSLVERHAGTVSAFSAGPGQGSEFVVRLPSAEGQDRADNAPAQRSSQLPRQFARGARVLVVDDNEDGAEMLAATLASYGCEVEVAHAGPEALKLAASHPFDAALLDIGLPVMDGYELAGRLRQLPHLAHTWLVAVTGYGQESDRKRALEAGFEDHLVKPVDLQMLETIIARLRAKQAG
ncbi:MAG: hybrid sensor histidine kinase/response regulator [Myxococcaceae bacterium]|nr:hybrid sensor histidine kinase/response regulator [Myxococcaceae bacterium]